MKKLSKQQRKERGDLAARLNKARDDLQEALNSYNEQLTELFEPVASARDDYNSAVAQANEWITNTRSTMEEYRDARSEAWQEGDAGSEYESWIGEWENELYECEDMDPELVEMPDCDGGDTLESLPDSAQ